MVEQEGREYGALWHPLVEDDFGRFQPVVAAGRGSAPQVGEEPSDIVCGESSVRQVAKKGSVVDSIKSLGKVDCHCHSSPGGASLVKTCDHLLGEWH